MKRRNAILLSLFGVLIVSLVAAALVLNSPPEPQRLPDPNGYNDFVAAAAVVIPWTGSFNSMSQEELLRVLEQNSNALVLLRIGLRKDSQVPLGRDINWMNSHLPQIAGFKSLAELLAAEGKLHLLNQRTNEAVASFTDCVIYGHALSRGGLIIDALVGTACEAIGLSGIHEAKHGASKEALRDVLTTLVAVDARREPVAEVLRRDREWSDSTTGPFRSMWLRMTIRQAIRKADQQFEKRSKQYTAALRLLICDLAIRLHQLEKGDPPNDLRDIVADQLTAVPLDPFSNVPFIYRRTRDSYLIYSVGPNGKNDGGTGDDLVPDSGLATSGRAPRR